MKRRDLSIAGLLAAAALAWPPHPTSTARPHLERQNEAVGRLPATPAPDSAALESGRQAVSAPPPAAPGIGPRHDAPDLAHSFHRRKRLGGAAGVDPRAAYRAALARVERMPRYSTRRGLRVDGPAVRAASSALEEWEPIGPGNIGGRTRTLLIHPKRPRIMYAAGVSGGIWKTTNNGRRWAPIADSLTNIAVNTMAMDPADPEVIYAGTGEGYFREEVRGTSLPLRGGGIFKTEDGGGSWERLESTAGRDFFWVNDIVVSHLDSDRIYAATRGGVFRSLDGGESWTRVRPTRLKGGCLDLAARTDLDTDYLLASCGTLGKAVVYRKVGAEGGGRWQKVLSEGRAMGRTSLAIAPSDPERVYALSASNVPGPGGHYEQALHAVFRSDAGGARGSWEATVRNGDARKVDTVLLHNAVFTNLVECGFDVVNEYLAMGWYVNTIAVDPRDPDRVWAAGVDWFRSDDGGESWNPVTYWWIDSRNRNFVHADQHGLVFHPRKPRTAFALNDGGIYRTRNADAFVRNDDLALCQPGSSGVTWQNLNNGYGVTQFYHGTAYPDGRSYLAGAQDNGTVLGTDGFGPDRWIPVFGGDGGYSAVNPENTDVVYVTIQNGIIQKATDGGFDFFDAMDGIDDLALNDTNNFRAFGDFFLFISPLVMDPNEPERLWSGGSRLWRTDDAAASWSGASARLEQGGKASAIAVAEGDSDRAVVGSDNGFIYRSDSATAAGEGTVWESTRPRAGFVSSVAFDPADSDRVYATYAGFGGRHVWRSDDAGRSWEPIDGGGDGSIPDVPVHSLVVDPGDSDRLYIGTDVGVFVSLDGGASWAVENTGYATAVTEWLAINGDRRDRTWLFAFTHGRGAWRVELDG